ncbi:MAG: precorrin-6A reductase [Planctomycetaceae bacterium]|nr:MAG: precorrin-6A reductase [Planctomycetaceae bacterium]
MNPNTAILLLGGTSETWPLAIRLANEGCRVLVSQATDVTLEIPPHPGIQCRYGPLDENALAELVDRRPICAIIDAAHPYASTIHAAAHRVAVAKGIPCLRYVRPAVVAAASPGVQLVPDHEAAATAAFSHWRPVLLTTGSRNLVPYAQQASRTGLPLVARILDHPSSRTACQRAGILPERIVVGRGPFSVETNRQHIRQFDIGVLVTKDSGIAGGTEEKLQAAQAEGCQVIVVTRPRFAPELDRIPAFKDFDSLVEDLLRNAEKK